jgi:hypothetical protein
MGDITAKAAIAATAKEGARDLRLILARNGIRSWAEMKKKSKSFNEVYFV